MKRSTRAGAGIFLVVGVALLALGFVLARPYVETLLYTQRIPTAPPLAAPEAAAPEAAAPATERPPLSATDQASAPPVLMPFDPDAEVDTVTTTPAGAPEATTAPAETPTASPTPTPTPVWAGVAPVEVSIPAIDLEAPVAPIGWEIVQVRGTEQAMWQVPNERVAGWHETSARLGVPGNTVLNGHNTGYGEVFRYLFRLEIGDQIFVTAQDGELYVYRVEEKYILREAGQPISVRLENARYIQTTSDERLTLVTCHPYGSLANRLIVIAYPVLDSELEEKGVS